MGTIEESALLWNCVVVVFVVCRLDRLLGRSSRAGGCGWGGIANMIGGRAKMKKPLGHSMMKAMKDGLEQ